MSENYKIKFAYLIEPPFNYRDENGIITGCDIELARHIFHQLGVNNIEFVETEFANLLPGLARGEWQMTTGLFATKKRQEAALFSRPIWALPDGLLTKVGAVTQITGYTSIAENPDTTLAVIQEQFQYQSAVELGVPQDRIIVFETYLDASQAVEDGRATAYASVARAHGGYLQQNPEATLKIVVVPPSEKPPAFGCFGFSIPDTKLQSAVDEVLKQFIGSNQHREMMRPFGFSHGDISLLV